MPFIADNFAAIRAEMESQSTESEILNICREMIQDMQAVGIVIRGELEWTEDNAEAVVSPPIPAPDRLALLSRTVFFGRGSAEMSDQYRDLIPAMARLAEKMEAASIRVEGYASHDERFLGDCTPLYLAARRATVVSEELRKALAYAGCPIRVRNMQTVPEMHILEPNNDPEYRPSFAKITLEGSKSLLTS